MAGETTLTVVGNLTSDPELRFTANGAAVANFTVASTPRHFDRQAGEFRDGETLFLRCTVWRDLAENVAESLQRGTRVIVEGRLKSRSFETKEGEKRTVMELDADDVGPSLRRATARVQKNNPGHAYQQGGGQAGSWGANPNPGWAGPGSQANGGDPWAASQPGPEQGVGAAWPDARDQQEPPF